MCHRPRIVSSALVLAAALLFPATAHGQGATPRPSDWTFRTRAFLSGSSSHSEPAGYKVYSGIGLEAALDRRIFDVFAIELSIRAESREVDVNQGSPTDTRLGSLELLPVNLLFQWHPLRGLWQPYVGAGVNGTFCWEKSGALDDTQVSPSLGPVLQAGIDLAVTDVLLVNVDLKWNLLRTDLSQGGSRYATLQIDPITIAAGVALRL